MQTYLYYIVLCGLGVYLIGYTQLEDLLPHTDNEVLSQWQRIVLSRRMYLIPPQQLACNIPNQN